MTPRQWLQLLASYHPGLERKAAAVVRHATRLSAEFPARAFTADSARAAAKMLTDDGEYADIAATLRHVMPERQAEANQSEDQRGARCWDRFIERRLSEGGNPQHLFSLLKACCPPAHLRQVLAAHFPDELAAMDAQDRRIAEHQARLRRMAEDATRRMQMPNPAPSRPVQPEPVSEAPKPRYLDGEHLAAFRRKAGIQQQGQGA